MSPSLSSTTFIHHNKRTNPTIFINSYQGKWPCVHGCQQRLYVVSLYLTGRGVYRKPRKAFWHSTYHLCPISRCAITLAKLKVSPGLLITLRYFSGFLFSQNFYLALHYRSYHFRSQDRLPTILMITAMWVHGSPAPDQTITALRFRPLSIAPFCIYYLRHMT